MPKHVLLFLIVFSVSLAAQQKDDWSKFNYLIGEWRGEGSGNPGMGEGSFSFNFDLGKNILVRKNHTIFPATENRPASVHDDLLIIYKNMKGEADKAIYFDNEKHTINYSVAASDDKLIFTSEKIAGVPVFRLTYSPLGTDKVNIKFEMSQDGQKFMTYLEGNALKIK